MTSAFSIPKNLLRPLFDEGAFRRSTTSSQMLHRIALLRVCVFSMLSFYSYRKLNCIHPFGSTAHGCRQKTELQFYSIQTSGLSKRYYMQNLFADPNIWFGFTIISHKKKFAKYLVNFLFLCSNLF